MLFSMAHVRFVAQPFADGADLRDFVSAVADDPSLTHLDVVVAWAKRSGLSRVREQLEEIRARPSDTRIIVGIDEGGATHQGLELARELFDAVHVFHDRSGRTFHPKVYLAWGEESARLLVGSQNATAGGVYFNYEAGIDAELILPEDEALLTSVQDYVARLYAEGGLCKELTDAVLAEMVANPRYRIGNEDDRHRPAPPGAPEELDAEVDVDAVAAPAAATPSIFGGSTEPKRPDPGVVGPTKQAAAKKAAASKKATPAKKAAPVKKAAAVGGGAPPAAPVAVHKRWFKRLSASDAQHPPTAGSNVTGVLRLVQAGHAINQTNYFRHDFFAPLPWAETPKPRGLFEQTVVPFDVVVAGVHLGVRNLRVDDAAYREAGQGNHTSVLHWDGLTATLAGTDHGGDFVVLERLADGSYRLEITPHDPSPGSFIL